MREEDGEFVPAPVSELRPTVLCAISFVKLGVGGVEELKVVDEFSDRIILTSVAKPACAVSCAAESMTEE